LSWKKCRGAIECDVDFIIEAGYDVNAGRARFQIAITQVKKEGRVVKTLNRRDQVGPGN
jgi:hypothetical protein